MQQCTGKHTQYHRTCMHLQVQQVEEEKQPSQSSKRPIVVKPTSMRAATAEPTLPVVAHAVTTTRRRSRRLMGETNQLKEDVQQAAQEKDAEAVRQAAQKKEAKRLSSATGKLWRFEKNDPSLLQRWNLYLDIAIWVVVTVIPAIIEELVRGERADYEADMCNLPFKVVCQRCAALHPCIIYEAILSESLQVRYRKHGPDNVSKAVSVLITLDEGYNEGKRQGQWHADSMRVGGFRLTALQDNTRGTTYPDEVLQEQYNEILSRSYTEPGGAERNDDWFEKTAGQMSDVFIRTLQSSASRHISPEMQIGDSLVGQLSHMHRAPSGRKFDGTSQKARFVLFASLARDYEPTLAEQKQVLPQNFITQAIDDNAINQYEAHMRRTSFDLHDVEDNPAVIALYEAFMLDTNDKVYDYEEFSAGGADTEVRQQREGKEGEEHVPEGEQGEDVQQQDDMLEQPFKPERVRSLVQEALAVREQGTACVSPNAMTVEEIAKDNEDNWRSQDPELSQASVGQLILGDNLTSPRRTAMQHPDDSSADNATKAAADLEVHFVSGHQNDCALNALRIAAQPLVSPTCAYVRDTLGFKRMGLLNFDKVAKAARVIYGLGGVVVARYPRTPTYLIFPRALEASEKVVILRHSPFHVDLFKDMVSTPSLELAVEWLGQHGYTDSEVPQSIISLRLYLMTHTNSY